MIQDPGGANPDAIIENKLPQTRSADERDKCPASPKRKPERRGDADQDRAKNYPLHHADELRIDAAPRDREQCDR